MLEKSKIPILYKYKSAINGLKILENQKIKLTKTKDLNDIYEIIPFINIKNNEMNIKIFAGYVKKKYIKYLKSEGNNIDNNIEYYKYILLNIKKVKKDLINIRNNMISGIKKTTEEMQERTAVYSLSCDYNNILMWAHYGNEFAGICVGFDFKEFKYNEIYKVKYKNKRPKFKIKLLKNRNILDKYIMKLMWTKGEMWKYEKEYRCIFNIDKEESKKEQILVDIQTKNIKEVYFSSKIKDEEYLRLLKTLREKKYKHVKLYKINKNEIKNTYELKAIVHLENPA